MVEVRGLGCSREANAKRHAPAAADELPHQVEGPDALPADQRERGLVRQEEGLGGGRPVRQRILASPRLRHGLVRHYSHALVRPTRPHSTQRGLSTIAAALVIDSAYGSAVTRIALIAP